MDVNSQEKLYFSLNLGTIHSLLDARLWSKLHYNE